MRLPTRGSLKDSKFIQLIIDAAHSHLTGMIRLEKSPIIKVVYFQRGTISFASSNEKSDRLTEVLKRAGKLTPEQVEDAQARLKPNVSLGKTLVELGYISAKDLLWGARAQVDGILQQLLFWNQGDYQLVEGTLPREIIHLNLSVPEVIFDGIMKTQDRDWILQHVGSPETIYKLSENFEKQSDQLKQVASVVTSNLNGQRTLSDIAQISGLDTFELCKTVVALEYLDLAHPVHGPQQLEFDVLGEEPIPSTLEPQSDLTYPETDIEQAKETTREEDAKTLSDLPIEGTAEAIHDAAQSEEDENKTILNKIDAEKLQPINLSAQADVYKPRPYRPIGYRESFNWKALFVLLLAGATIIFAALSYFRRPENKSVSRSTESTKPPAQPQVTPIPAPPKPAETTQSTPAPTPKTEDTAPKTEVPALAVTADNPVNLLRSGKIPEAAKSWKNQLARNRNGYSIQVVIACQEKTVMDAYQLLNYSNDIIVLPVTFRGENCYRVLFGQYESRQFAQAAIRNLPDVFMRQRSPANVVALSQLPL